MREEQPVPRTQTAWAQVGGKETNGESSSQRGSDLSSASEQGEHPCAKRQALHFVKLSVKKTKAIKKIIQTPQLLWGR